MSSSIRSLASDTVVYGMSTVLSRFLTFLLTPLFTNFLTKQEVGEISGIYAMIAFVNILYSLGMEPAFMRFWEKGNDEHNARVFSVAYWTVALLGLVVTVLTIAFAEPITTSSVLQLGEGGARYVAIAACIPLLDALVLIPFARLTSGEMLPHFGSGADFSLIAKNLTFAPTSDWSDPLLTMRTGNGNGTLLTMQSFSAVPEPEEWMAATSVGLIVFGIFYNKIYKKVLKD